MAALAGWRRFSGGGLIPSSRFISLRTLSSRSSAFISSGNGSPPNSTALRIRNGTGLCGSIRSSRSAASDEPGVHVGAGGHRLPAAAPPPERDALGPSRSPPARPAVLAPGLVLRLLVQDLLGQRVAVADGRAQVRHPRSFGPSALGQHRRQGVQFADHAGDRCRTLPGTSRAGRRAPAWSKSSFDTALPLLRSFHGRHPIVGAVDRDRSGAFRTANGNRAPRSASASQLNGPARTS